MNLAKAISIAAVGFQDKFDKAGRPYILHCLRVMDKMETDEEKIVAILHDTIEDGVCTIKDLIDQQFSTDVIYSLILLTHTKKDTYDEYIRKISGDALATKVKLADLKDNSDITRLKGLTKKDFDRMEKYHRSYVYLSKLK
jgi:(p)ppGpp synthase/HD superfamily hydrolase